MRFFSEDHVEQDLSRHFSNYFQHFKISEDEKFWQLALVVQSLHFVAYFLNLPFYNPKKIEGYEMSYEDVNKTIKYLERKK